MILLLASLLLQTGVDAGPASVSCDGSPVTLSATPIDPPANYMLEWEDGVMPGKFLVVNPLITTEYRVFLTDLDTLEVFEDTTRVLVHPISADLAPDGNFDLLDWLAFYDAWGEPPLQPEFDPDLDGEVSILDWFYLCNHDAFPINTPPQLTVQEQNQTFRNETVTVPYDIMDAETGNLSLTIDTQPAHGTALLLSGILRYIPGTDYVGPDSFEVHVVDGNLVTENVEIGISVLQPDTWTDLYDDIFFIRCKACHIDAVSGGLSLSTYLLAQQGGVSGAGFLAGNPEASPVYLRVANGDMPLGMPPLSTEEVERIRIWILRGAAQ